MKFGIEWQSKPYEEVDIGPDWVRMNGGYVRCLTANKIYSSLEIIVPPNTNVDFHLHPDADEEFYVIEGHAEITALAKTVHVKEGEIYKIKAGLLHKVYYPYGMRGIVTLRKVFKGSANDRKTQFVENLLKIKKGAEAPEIVEDVKPPSTPTSSYPTSTS
jgi:mannose-6-phosphate isomerase-like protein (cupin superfamily)